MANRLTRPKGYLTKGKTKSPDAARKAKAKQIFTPKGFGKEVFNAVLNGGPAGRGAKAVKSASKLEQIIIKNMRKKAAGIGQRAIVTSGQAKLIASQMDKAPVKRSRDIIKKDSGRGLSAREKQQLTKRDTITRPKPNKPRTKKQIQTNVNSLRLLNKDAREKAKLRIKKQKKNGK